MTLVQLSVMYTVRWEDFYEGIDLEVFLRFCPSICLETWGKPRKYSRCLASGPRTDFV